MALTHVRVTGDWCDLIPDTPNDPDPLPDQYLPAGNIHLVPTNPGPHITGGTSYTVADVTALISAGELHDLQGRAGVWITGQVGDTPIEWEAHITLHRPHAITVYPVRFFPTELTHITSTGVTQW